MRALCVLHKALLSHLRDGEQQSALSLSDISPAGVAQGDLFADPTPQPSATLMPILDKINLKMDKGAIKLGSDGIEQAWQMKTGNKSPAYTTCWDELAVVGKMAAPIRNNAA